jgi:putative Mn2+ efflux pump MntP
MGLAEITGIAVALGVDCLAVSVGVGSSGPRRSTIALVAGSFGVFQFAMALAGMYGGAALETLVNSSLRLVAPILVGAVGVLMITKGLKCEQPSLKLLGLVTIVGASLSVSLDALAAGVALGLVGGLSVLGAVVIGAVSVAMSLVGFAGGKVLARRTGLAEDIGGGFLIVLAVAMFVSNL